MSQQVGMASHDVQDNGTPTSLLLQSWTCVTIQRISLKPPQVGDGLDLIFLSRLSIAHVPTIPRWIASDHFEATVVVIKQPMAHSSWDNDHVPLLDGSLDSRGIVFTAKACKTLIRVRRITFWESKKWWNSSKSKTDITKPSRTICIEFHESCYGNE